MSDDSKTYICPKCLGIQQSKGKCKQCGYKFMLTDDEYLAKIESGEMEIK